MKILIVDDDGFLLSDTASSEGDTVVETLRVVWNDDEATHHSASDAARDILSRNPDAVFLDHDLGYKSAVWGRSPETGEDVAHYMRERGYVGRVIGTSKKDQPYCDSKSGKTMGKPLSWLVEFAQPVLTTENKV